MEGSVEVVVSELHAAAERLRDAGQRLQDGLSSVDLETRQLLGSGWQGGAASAYAPAWDQWHTGAGQVVRGLQTMADLLKLSGKEYAKTDQQSGDALNATMQTGGGDAPAGGGGGGGGTPVAPASEPLTGLAQMMNLEQLGSVAESAQSAPQQLGGFLQQGAEMAGGFVEQVSSMVEGAAAGGDAQGEEPPTPEPQSDMDRDTKQRDER
ncbi:WXG100 family type VII secretion target [Mycobacterium sp. 236(2023)]|uniref:WXG100 family type VII secretion target n=1 Tax=Mycobacterium sp. 236(2023) TaxID=3038163 RepID=UPI002414FA34|nr:WXG100 family type VII secretion target [Mycobacterium sp. 236(2023)]MDG4668286.1 WXG100 family type VII secretion target [Mycobacterium sp. 236(2023)]